VDNLKFWVKGKLKEKIKLTKESKIKIKRMRIKLKKKQEYGSKDEIGNKLKFDKRAKNQN